MAKQKFYTVWVGKTSGVYSSWEDCKKQTDGFPEAKYKSFSSRQEAEQALQKNYWAFVNKEKKSPAKLFEAEFHSQKNPIQTALLLTVHTMALLSNVNIRVYI